VEEIFRILQVERCLLEGIGGILLRTRQPRDLSACANCSGPFGSTFGGLYCERLKTYCPRCSNSYFASTCWIVPAVSLLMKFSATTTSLG
jgi:hypothetical protein